MAQAIFYPPPPQRAWQPRLATLVSPAGTFTGTSAGAGGGTVALYVWAYFAGSSAGVGGGTAALWDANALGPGVSAGAGGGSVTFVPPPAPWVVYPATAAQIALALAGVRAPVLLRYRYEQQDLSGHFLADLTAAVSAATIQQDNDRLVCRTATITVDPARLPAGFLTAPLAQQNIAVYAEVYVPDTRGWERLGLGVFRPDAPQRTLSPQAQQSWQYSASDLTVLLAGSSPTTSYTVASGSSYLAAVAAIVAPFGLRTAFPSDLTLTPVAFTFPPQTASWLEIANTLLFGINYYPLWADSAGILTTRPRIDPMAEPAAVLYTTLAEPRFVRPPLIERQDLSRFPNQCTVTIDDPSRTIANATKTNADPGSPLSTVSKGATTPLIIKGGGSPSSQCVLSQTTCAAIADFQLREAVTRSLVADLTTLPDPRRGGREFYQLAVDSYEASTQWRQMGWSYDCKVGADMKHTVGRAQAVTLS